MSNQEMTEMERESTGMNSPSQANVSIGEGSVQAEPDLNNYNRQVEEQSMQETNHTIYTEQDEIAQKGTRLPLYRHPTHRIFGGVCGGIADYLNLDSGLVRILWLVLSIPTAGAGFLAYLVLWLLLPVGTSQTGLQERAALSLNERNVQRAGTLLVGIGALWFLANLGILPWIWNAFWSVVGVVFWPALLIGAGLLLLKNQKDWRVSFVDWRARIRNNVQQRSSSVKVDRESVKNGMRQIQQRIPLKRSRTDRLWLGVSGGMARTFHLDANLIRLFWVLFSLGTLGFGALIYAIIGAVLPEQPVEHEGVEYELSYNNEPKPVQIIDGRAR
jgi:phage shock protein C